MLTDHNRWPRAPAPARTPTHPSTRSACQFENVANAQAHYESTGPEIFAQTGGDIDAFVCAAGTGGTIGGMSRYLKEKKPDCKVYIIDPEVLTGTQDLS